MIQLKNLRPASFNFNHILYLFIFLFSLTLMFSTFRSQSHQLFIDSKLWSDFGAHIPLIRSFSLGENIPPEYPTFPGEPIRYHFLFYFLVGIMERVGINLGLALNILSALGFSLLLIMIFQISSLLFKKSSAGVLAIFLFLFNGSLSFLTYFQKTPISLQSFQQIISNDQFSSFGPWDGNIVSAFWNLNIYSNQRHLGLGFGVSLVIIWILLKIIVSQQKTKKKYYLISIIILVTLPFLHQASFFMTLSTLFFLIVFNIRQLKNFTSFLLMLLVSSIPGLIYLFSRHGASIQYLPGFLSQNNSIFSLSEYWFYNIGLYLLLIPFVFIFANSLQRKVLLSVLPLFIIANLFRLSPDMINNHKLINFFMIFVVILTAGQLVSFWNRKNIIKPFVIALVFLLTFSGFIDFFPIFNDQAIALNDYSNDPTAAWIQEYSAPDSIFLTTTYLYNPASISGRKTFLDYGYFNWSLGYDDFARKQLLPQLFSSTIKPSQVCNLLSSQSIDYILIHPESGEIPDVNPHDSTIATQFTPIFSSQLGYDIYHVSENCQNF